MSSLPTWFAVRVTVLNQETGEVFTRDYVRGQQKIGQTRFVRFALGDMLLVCDLLDTSVRIRYEEVSFETVRENRVYGHTTHDESGQPR